MSSIAVVGGGVAGLAAAATLKRRGHTVLLFESADRVGGVIGSEHADGFLVEHGANSMAPAPAAAAALLSSRGLDERRLAAAPAARRRYVVRGGRPVPIPGSPLGLLTTPLLSPAARLRIAAEPLRGRDAPAAEGEDESIAELVRRRMGQEVVEYGLEPVVSGVYAGDAARLSARYAFPRISALEREHGSLVRGMVRATRAGGGAGRRGIHSFPDGMEEIVAALRAGLEAEIRTGTAVERVRVAGAGVELTLAAGAGEAARTLRFDGAVLATPAYRLAELARDLVGAQRLAAIRYLPVGVLSLGFRRDAVAHPLDGFGMLVPRVERLPLMGVLFSSTVFAGRAPDGHVLLTVMIGGAHAPEMAALDEAAVCERVLPALTMLLGVRGEPVLRRLVRWPRAIPQYEVGHGELLTLMETVEAAHPAVALAGSYRQGVAVGDAIASGVDAADRLAAAIAGEPALPRAPAAAT